jgi:hypothetical protein
MNMYKLLFIKIIGLFYNKLTILENIVIYYIIIGQKTRLNVLNYFLYIYIYIYICVLIIGTGYYNNVVYGSDSLCIFNE